MEQTKIWQPYVTHERVRTCYITVVSYKTLLGLNTILIYGQGFMHTAVEVYKKLGRPEQFQKQNKGKNILHTCKKSPPREKYMYFQSVYGINIHNIEAHHTQITAVGNLLDQLGRITVPTSDINTLKLTGLCYLYANKTIHVYDHEGLLTQYGQNPLQMNPHNYKNDC